MLSCPRVLRHQNMQHILHVRKYFFGKNFSTNQIERVSRCTSRDHDFSSGNKQQYVGYTSVIRVEKVAQYMKTGLN